MPTSATGPSSKTLRPGPAAARASGFTLLEVLVVVVIIGIITSMAVVSTSVLGGDHEMDQEAARLGAVIGQAREDAMLLGRDVGLRIDTTGYDFLRYDGRSRRWQLASDDPLLRERSFPEGMFASLRLEARDVQLPPRSAASDRQPPLPQIVIQASGDLVPFEIVLRRDGTEEERRIAGSVEGTLVVTKGDDRSDR